MGSYDSDEGEVSMRPVEIPGLGLHDPVPAGDVPIGQISAIRRKKTTFGLDSTRFAHLAIWLTMVLALVGGLALSYFLPE